MEHIRFEVDNFIATITTGRAWPNGQPGPEPGRVIILTAEDQASDYRRRLTAAGADLKLATMLSAVRRNERDELFPETSEVGVRAV